MLLVDEAVMYEFNALNKKTNLSNVISIYFPSFDRLSSDVQPLSVVLWDTAPEATWRRPWSPSVHTHGQGGTGLATQQFAAPKLAPKHSQSSDRFSISIF